MIQEKKQEKITSEGKYYLVLRELACQFCHQPTATDSHKGKNWCGSVSCLNYYYSRNKFQ